MTPVKGERAKVTLIDLPTELLQQIFVRCHPADLAALRISHRYLDNHLRNAPHLWKQVYGQYWDPYTSCARDALVTAALPLTKSVTRIPDWPVDPVDRKGKQREVSVAFDYAQQVQRRTWAEKQISRLQKRPIDTYANYNETLRTLLSVARSRSLRPICSSEQKETADYLVNLLTGSSNIQNFRQLIYPRADVKQLREWQLKQLSEQHGKQALQLHAQRRKDEKRARTSSSASVTPTKAKRSRTSSAGISSALNDVSLEQEQASRLASPIRRRSARVQLHAYPVELHHLLYDKRTQNLITLDDGTGVAILEDLDVLDEQAAAELHVLHGIHPGFRDKANVGSTTGVSRTARQLQQALEESEDEDSDFIDAGTPTDPHFTDMEDDLSEAQHSDESEEDDVDDNVFRFFVDQLDLRRHYREPALGTDLGHENSTRLRGRAREIVYDTARYGPENSYGPLRAWRERYASLDGTGFQTVEEGLNDDSEAGSDVETIMLELEDEEADDPTDSATDHSSPGERSDGDIVEEEDDEEVNAIPEAAAEDEEDEEETGTDDEDFDGHSDAESEMSNLLWELREMAIAHSRGLVPYHESKRLKTISPSNRQESGAISIWRSDKRVDWTIVEAIMVVMYCNIRHAVLSHGWGLSFRLPRTNRSLNGQDQYARQLNADNASTQAGAWRDMVGLPCGWSHSRGAEDGRKVHPPSPEDAKPYDWAGVESTWIGTYAFLDWSKWASFNARDPISRGFPDPKQELNEAEGNECYPMLNTASTPSLEGEREALGDCLQLRMELLPLAQQRPRNEHERVLSYLEGNDVDCIDVNTLEEVESGKSSCQMMRDAGQYPPLRFHGHTRTYLDDGPPVPRGELYGTVRPIFAECEEGEQDRAIIALHWDITHRYDGEDAWSLSGVQAGPPGTRAPIYGIWGAAARRDNLSPCGPFTYYMASERPWREVEEELQTEQPRARMATV